MTVSFMRGDLEALGEESMSYRKDCRREYQFVFHRARKFAQLLARNLDIATHRCMASNIVITVCLAHPPPILTHRSKS